MDKTRKPSKLFLRFLKEVNKVRDNTRHDSVLINTSVFMYFTKQKIEIDLSKHAKKYNFGLEYGYFNEELTPCFAEEESYVDAPLDMIGLGKSIKKIMDFMDIGPPIGFMKYYSDYFDAPFDKNDRRFWEEVFKMKLLD